MKDISTQKQRLRVASPLPWRGVGGEDKSVILTCLLLLILLLPGCDDPEEVLDPAFTVEVPTTITAGEEVTFQIDDAPDFLTFYSGEPGHEYRYRDRTKAEGTLSLSFKNAQKFGLNENATGTLSVLASTDYDGSGTPEAVAAATWTDISDRFDIATAYDFTWTESGVADITDLDNGKPIYFAFKFYAEEHAGTGSRQPEWRIADFSILLDSDDTPEPLVVANDESPGWRPVDVQGVVDQFNEGKWYYDSGNDVWRFRGGPSEYANEDWLITNPINLTSVEPDQGTPLKNYATALDEFTYLYPAAGKYTLTFVGKNTTIYGSKETVKEYTLTVTE